jgi:hypothetical protein
MNVVARVIWGVKLYDPVNAGDVQTTCRDIRAEKDARIRVAKFEKRVCALLLLLFSLQKHARSGRTYVVVVCVRTYVKVEDGNVNVVQQLAMVLDRIAAGEKDDNFLFEVLFEEGKEKKETSV